MTSTRGRDCFFSQSRDTRVVSTSLPVRLKAQSSRGLYGDDVASRKDRLIKTARKLSAGSIENLAAGIQKAIRILLEDAPAPFRVKGVHAAFVAQSQRALGQWRAADGALFAHGSSTSSSGDWARTNCPLSTSTRRTRPSAVERISLNSFIASINPMTCPTVTVAPACTYGGDCGDPER